MAHDARTTGIRGIFTTPPRRGAHQQLARALEMVDSNIRRNVHQCAGQIDQFSRIADELQTPTHQPHGSRIGQRSVEPVIGPIVPRQHQ